MPRVRVTARSSPIPLPISALRVEVVRSRGGSQSGGRANSPAARHSLIGRARYADLSVATVRSSQRRWPHPGFVIIRLADCCNIAQNRQTGQIENWFVSLNAQPVFIPGTQSIIETIGAIPAAGPQPCLSVVGLPSACYADDGQAYKEVPPPGVGASGVASATTARGQWSGPQPVGVPEPDGLLLALTGFAVVACLRLASVPSQPG
jgi:hypothetical protein